MSDLWWWLGPLVVSVWLVMFYLMLVGIGNRIEKIADHLGQLVTELRQTNRTMKEWEN